MLEFMVKNKKIEIITAIFLAVIFLITPIKSQAETGLSVGAGNEDRALGASENIFWGVASSMSSSTAGYLLMQKYDSGSYTDVFKVDFSGRVMANEFCFNGGICVDDWTELGGGLGTGGDMWTLNGSNLFASSTSWNVGIGTTNIVNPQGWSKVLQVGSATAGGAAVSLKDGSNDNWDIATFANNLWISQGSNNPYIFIKNAGNVGIGTTNPTHKLDINGDVNISGKIIVGNNQYFSARNASGLIYDLMRVNTSNQLQVSGVYNTSIYIDNYADGVNEGTFFRNLRSGTVEQLALLSNGNVGVRLSNPSSTLDIAGTLRNSSAVTHSLLGGSGNRFAMFDNSGSLYLGDDAAVISTINNYINNIGNGNFGFWNLQNGVISNIGSISSSVGVNTGGTSISGVSFAVAQGQTGGGCVYVNSGQLNTVYGTNTNFNNTFKVGDDLLISGYSSTTITWISSTTEQMTVSPSYSSAIGCSEYNLGGVPVGGAARFVVKGSGQVGIGTASPQASLHISSEATNESSNLAILVSSASSTGAFSVDRSGKISLGTTTADELLNIGGGKIFIADSASSTPVENRLYSTNGELYWSGKVIGGASSSPWVLQGGTIVASNSAWNVAIGSSTLATEALAVHGRIYLGDMIAPAQTGNKLYSVSGKLFWNGAPVGSDATTTWALSGNNLYSSSTAWNIAIGGTNPGSYKLHVTGNSYFSGSIAADGGLIQDSFAVLNGSDTWLRTTGATGWYNSQFAGGWFMSDTSWIRNYNAKPLYITGNNNQAAVFMSGAVGIGTSNPNAANYLLEVNGNAYFNNTVNANTSATNGNGYSFNAGLGRITTAYPVFDNDAVNMLYVNEYVEDAAFLKLDGSTTMAGDLAMGGYNITGANQITASKLNVDVIDPLYSIDGIKYATFGASFAGGLKEEYTGKELISAKTKTGEYEKVIDFDKLAKGNDLWLWRQVVDFSKDNVEAVITPYGRHASVYYVIEDNKLIFRSDRQTEISYRLTGRRFDWKEWPTKPLDQSGKGMLIR